LLCLASTSTAAGQSGLGARTHPGKLLPRSAIAGGGQTGQSGTPTQGSTASATLEQCVTAVLQSERSATFSGGMTAIPGSARMLMRVDVQVLAPGEAVFHTITTPGLGLWRSSDWGVKIYRYVKQVTNLVAPALYRAVVHFRWLNAGGHLIKAVERHTSRCEQPAPPPTPVAVGR
jgi:cystathionine beta-lyase/cystathionine gamma-synthase